jgi:hypothetical protein
VRETLFRVYGKYQNNNKRRKWWNELRQETVKDIDVESTSE